MRDAPAESTKAAPADPSASTLSLRRSRPSASCSASCAAPFVVHAQRGADLPSASRRRKPRDSVSCGNEAGHAVPGRDDDDGRGQPEQRADADEHVRPQAAEAPVVPLQLLHADE